jgi:hypothetical protein
MSNPFDNLFSEDMLGSSDMFPIISLDERSYDLNIISGDILPILPLRNMVLYPGVLLPVSVARSKSLNIHSAQVSRDDAPSSARRWRIEFGQTLESTPSRTKPCYPCRDADAGSVPCSTSKTYPSNPFCISHGDDSSSTTGKGSCSDRSVSHRSLTNSDHLGIFWILSIART